MVDRFKTQVMFLHPEPAVMEPCARRLGDEFSVHMAASGTEALTTMGITPIDVIVSAQELPGMTGQEALKEAKRRSPDTHSILVASAQMTEADCAALVNVRHLNRVLRAQSTPDEICAAIHAVLNNDSPASLPTPANDASAAPEPHPGGDTGQFSAVATGSFTATQTSIPVLEPGATPEVTSQAISHVEIVVLTNDASFLKTIRAATGTSHVVNHARNLQEGIDIVREGASGVLITDAAVAVKDVETITAQLRRHMPSLVTIVAGRREDGEKMMGLINDGLVYRFLLKPISPGRSRLAIEASAKKHLSLLATDVPLTPQAVQEKMTETGIIKGVTFDSGLFRTTDVRQTDISLPDLDDELEPGLFSRLGQVPVAAWAVAGVAAIGLVFLLTRGGGGDPAVPASVATESQITAPAEQSPPVTAPPPIDPAVAAAEALAAGDAARRAGQLVLPAEDNAVMHYASAARLQREDPVARARLDAVLDDVFAQVEQDFLADRLDVVDATLAVLNTHVGSHPRLAFLNRELGKEMARQEFSRIESDILAGNLDSAARRLDALESSGTVDAAIVASTRERLRQLRAASSARAPTPAPATAAASAPSRQPDTTETPARTGGSANNATAAGASNAVNDLLERANARLNAGQLVTPPGDSARDYFAATLAQDPQNAVARQGLEFIASLLLTQARTALDAGNLADAEQRLAQASVAGADAAGIAALRNAIGAARDAQRAASTPPAPVRSQPAAPATEPPPAPAEEPDFTLVQIEAPPPSYPRNAQRRGIEGWVDVSFTVLADGSTTDVEVLESEPGSTFDRAAINAVSRWRYSPLDTDDPSASARARIRLEFNLSD